MNADLGNLKQRKLVKDKDLSSEFEHFLFKLDASPIAVTSLNDKTNAEESIIFISAKNYIYQLNVHYMDVYLTFKLFELTRLDSVSMINEHTWFE